MKNDFQRTIIRYSSFIFLIVIAIFLVRFLSSFRFNSSSSMPMGVYRVSINKLSRGDLVEVCLPDRIAKFAFERGYLSAGRCANGIEPVIKQVVGMQGDVVDIKNNLISINQKPLAHSQTFAKDRKGRVLFSVERGQLILKQNEVWLYGNHDVYSFDSRYFGAIDRRLVRSVLKPVFVFDDHAIWK